MSQKAVEIIAQLADMTDPVAIAGKAHYGINTEKAFGISMPDLRAIAKNNKKNHELALELWASGYHEARILASMVDDPQRCSEQQMEQWVVDFNSWDLCDQCCFGLFAKSAYGWQKALEWPHREEEYVRRAGFALMAAFTLSKSKSTDKELLSFFPLIERYSTDERNFVRKAVNWALRQIGKRNLNLNTQALILAEKLMNSDNKTARWIGKDAYRELCQKRDKLERR